MSAPARAEGLARPGLFVTGTDTGVGKTTVAVALARLALRRGRAPIPFKPVETGCDPDPDDARRLWEAARPPTTLRETCPFPFELAAAPAAAAAAAGQRLELDELVTRAESVAARGDFLIVEGAGGLLVPYQDSFTNADIALRLRLPVLVVGRTALGTINHTALTLGEIGRRRLELAGVILVRTSEPLGAHESSNARLIEAVTGTCPLGTLPFLSPDARADPDRAADALAGTLSAEALVKLLG